MDDPTCYLNNKDWTDGYYHSSGVIADMKFKQKLSQKGIHIPMDEHPNSPMLRYQSRIMLHYLYPDDDWFAYKKDNEDNYKKILRYQHELLYSETQGMKSALIDLRPLPRSDYKKTGLKWPYANIDENKYKKAFSYNMGKSSNNPTDSIYTEMSNKRGNIIRNLFISHQIPVVIGIGERKSKENYFINYFTDRYGKKPVFIEHRLTKDKAEVSIAELEMEQFNMVIILSDFFNHRNGIGLEGLNKLTNILDKYITV